MNRSYRPAIALMGAAAACLVLTAVPLLAQQGGGPPKGGIPALIRGLPQPPIPASED